MTVEPTDGQRRVRPSLRGRDQSGLLVGRDPRPLARRLDELTRLVDSFPQPVWCCGVTAAALHGMDGCTLAAPFHLVVPHGTRVARFGHHVHVTRSIDLIDRGTALGFAVTSPTRTLIDLAAGHPAEVVLPALESALRDGGTSEDFLHRRVNALRRQGRSGPGQLVALLEAYELGRGGHTWLEQEFIRLLYAAGLPRPHTQQVLGRRRDRLIRVDCSFPGTNLVVEVLGYRWHRTRLQMQVDSERINALQLGGKLVLQFTYDDVVAASPVMFATIRLALSGVPQMAR